MSTDGTHPDIPEKDWTNPFPEGHALHDLFGRRVRNNQDLVILIDDYHSRRGTGKTVASLQLAEGMDQNGGLTWANVSMSPQEVRNGYSQLPQRSAIVLDEGEVGASNRDSQTKTNKALREIMSMGRVEEKYVIMNTPSVNFLDKHIRQLADVWITMVAKGLGMVHFFEGQPYAKGSSSQLLTPKKGMIQFKDIKKGTRLRDVYNQLTAEKRKHIKGEKGENNLISQKDHEEALQKAREEAQRETRNEIIKDIYRRLSDVSDDDMQRMKRARGVSQAMIAEAVGLSQQQVGNIIRNK